MARSRNIGSIYAELSLRDNKFKAGVKGAMASLKSFAGGALAMGAKVATAGGVAVAAAGTAAAAGLMAGTKATIAMGAELDHLSSQTGVAVSQLMQIRQAYKDSGKDAASAAKDINKMQRAIADAADAPGSSIDFFAQIGLSAEKLLAMNPADQFFAIGEAIKGIENPTRQAQAAMDIFGKSGGELLTVFKGSSLEDVNAALGKMPEIMEKFSAQMERADTLIGRLPNKSEQFFTGFTAGVIGQIVPALEDVNAIDFTELGMKLGDSLSGALEILTSGKVWDLFSLHAKIAMERLRTEAGGGVVNAWSAAANTWWERAKNLDFANPFSATDRQEILDSFDKYAIAGLSETTDIIRGHQDEINNILDEIEKKRKVDIEFNVEIPPDMSHLWNQDGSPAAPSQESMAPYVPDPIRPAPSSQSQINAMQARGLAQGAVTITKGEQQQIGLLKEILAELKSFPDEAGPLVWTT